MASSLPPLGPEPTAPGCARSHVREILAKWRLDHVADDAGLIVSELMTNAVKVSRHRRTPVGVRLLGAPGQLIIEVWDRSPDDPHPCFADGDMETGRGLAVVSMIASRWSYYRTSGWKVVWAELLTEDPLAVMPGA